MAAGQGFGIRVVGRAVMTVIDDFAAETARLESILGLLT
jgi:hypothetical protein